MPSASDRLSASDLTSPAVETPDSPMHVGAIVLLDGHVPLAEVRRRIEDGLRAAPRLRQVVVRARWVDDPGFRIERHVTPAAIEPPAGEDELLRLAERLLAAPLDRARFGALPAR